MKRIAVMLGVSHPLVKRWREEAGITGKVGPTYGCGTLKGQVSIERSMREARDAWDDECAGVREYCRSVCWSRDWMVKTERSRSNSRKQARKQWANRASDPHYRFAKALRLRVWKVCKRSDVSKSAHTFSLTGCTEGELREHIQGQFGRDMQWSNYGSTWEVDHIVPCNSFDLSNPDEQRRCFHWSNLRPLAVSENRRKSWLMQYPQQVGLGI